MNLLKNRNALVAASLGGSTRWVKGIFKRSTRWIIFKRRDSRLRRERSAASAFTELTLLEFQRSDIKLKERLDYAYRNLLLLKDVCLGLGIFFVTSEVGIYLYLFRTPEYEEFRAVSTLGFVVSCFFFLCLSVLLFEVSIWENTQKPMFKAAGLRYPPYFILTFVLILCVLITICFALTFSTIPASYVFPPPPMPTPPMSLGTPSASA